MIETITGVILAGGKSTRMGRDKALLPYQNQPLIQSVIEKMRSVFSRVVVSVAGERRLDDLKVEQIVDHYSEVGPLGGITSALEQEKRSIFCVACDMPFLNSRLIEFLCGLKGFDAVVPNCQDRLQVLHALYSYNMLPFFQDALRTGQFRISDSFPQANIQYVSDQEIRSLDPEGTSFHNLNTPSDYQHLVRNSQF
jgi:molybdopterin-guanine dinucleotide biosynthesis protein A